MTNLTEQLHQGTLPDNHHYYYKMPNGKCEIGNIFYIKTLHWCKDGDKIEVIAEVPSYEEFQNMNEAVNECMAANIKLVEQNRKLKELLKEVTELTKKISEVLGEE